MKFYNKIKFNCKNDISVSQIYIFDVPILQYEKIDGKMKNFKLIYSVKPNSQGPVFYLKFNSTNYFYSLFCIKHWVYIAKKMNCDYYIICDKTPLIEVIAKKLIFPDSDIKFIKSDYSIPKKIVKGVSNDYWRKATYAHLTSFYHANKNNIKTFFNIDADDTSFFMPDNTIAKALKKVMKIAKTKGYDCYSLDMHSTFSLGAKWNFGVTYVRNGKKCIDNCKNYNQFTDLERITLDAYFNRCRKEGKLKLGHFNIDNLYFMHWGQWGVSPALRLLQLEKERRMYYPFMDYFSNSDEKIFQEVPDWVDTIDCNINENDSFIYLKKTLGRKIKNVIPEFI